MAEIIPPSAEMVKPEGTVLEQTAREVLTHIWRMEKTARRDGNLAWAQYIQAVASSCAFLFEHWGHAQGGCDTPDCPCWLKGAVRGSRFIDRIFEDG